MESQMMVFNPRQTQIKIPKFSSPSDEGHNKMVETSRCLNLEYLTFMKLITDPNYFSKFVHPAQIHQNYWLRLTKSQSLADLQAFQGFSTKIQP